MATQPRLVNKQFNSPINLYSKQNVQDVLDRETQILANGAVGINFLNSSADKPGNLKNSAVLRMLEEEENRQRYGYGPGAKRVAWPPPSDTGIDGPYSEEQQQQQQTQQSQQYQQQQSTIPAKGGPQYSSQAPSAFQQNTYQAPVQSTPRSPLKPLDVSQQGTSPLASPIINQSPQGFRSATPSKGWAPVYSPVGTSTQPSWQQSATATRYQSAHQSVSQQTYVGQQYTPVQYQATPQQRQAPPQQYQAPPQQHQASPQQYQAPPQQYQAPSQQQQTPQQYQAPSQQHQPSQQYQASSQQHQAPPQQYQASSQQSQAPSQQFYSRSAPSQSIPNQDAAPTQVAPAKQTKPFEPPPTTITLRPQAPVSQTPAPLVTSQPATATLRVNVNPKNLRGDLKWPPEPVKKKMLEEAANVDYHNSFLSLEGGKHLRGDLKWPPENVKHQMAEEHRLLLELAKGPNCKPPRPNKDYTDFFAQHALNSMYPGYKIPPGTQYYRPID